MKKIFTGISLLFLLAGAAGCAPATTMPQFVTEQAPKQETPAVEPATAEPASAPITTSAVSCRAFQSTAQADDWVKGNPAAPITIIEYSDFQCPYCAQFTNVLQDLLQQYPDDIKVVFRHFPLSFHPYAQITARAAEAAGLQGKFWEYQDILFQNQDSWSNLDEQGVQSFLNDSATSLGLDMNQFASDMESNAVNQKIINQTDFGTAEGVTGTPFVIVNGMQWQGVDQANMQQLIESLKAKPQAYSECPPTVLDQNKSYTAVIETRNGEIEVKLASQDSPTAVNAFAYMSQRDWYKDQNFFRVIRDEATKQLKFILGGNQTNQGWYTLTPEASSLQFDHKGVVGLINGSQFFIAMEAAPDLNGHYSIIGEISQGMDVLESMVAEGEPILNIRIVEE